MALLRFKPLYQTYIWGGDRLRTLYGRVNTPYPAAESWELSDRPEAMSRTAEGKPLSECISGRFPLLIKVIDAKESLSVQVHPNEKVASLLQAEPKSECWIALEKSDVYVGLSPGVTAQDLLKAIENQSLPSLLLRHTLEPGQAIYIPAGTIHAICAGALLFEVQQNSNTTYRLYDWGRDRPLHLKEGLASLDLNARPRPTRPEDIQSPYFAIRLVEKEGRWEKESSFETLFCTEGEGEIIADGKKEAIRKGESVFIPAAVENVAIKGRCRLIHCSQPKI